MVKNLKNILVVRTDRIGDVVLTTPVFKALRKAYPLARLTVLVVPSTVDLVKGNPYIDVVMVDDRKHTHKDLFGFILLAREIRQQNFDAVFILHTKRRYNLACYLAGIPLRIGYKNNKFGSLLTCPLKDERHLGQMHEAVYSLNALKPLGIEPQGMDLFLPVDKHAEDWVVQWRVGHGLDAMGLIAIHPGASDPTKCWPVERFAQLIDRLSQRYSYKVILIGGEESIKSSQAIMRLTSTACIDLSGQCSLAQTSSLLRRCRLLISNDSGPVHVGAAAGINVISLFLRNQPGINPIRWAPLGPNSYVLANKVGEEILLNSKGQISSGKPDSITVDEVLDLVESIFRKDNQSIFSW